MNITDSKFYRDKCYINGEWIGADSGETISVNNPATLKEIGTVPKCETAETKRAIEAANEAWPEWKAKSARQRSDILRKWFDLMIAGKKNKEFRKPSKWIDSRLIGKSYNFVKFTNGYGNDKPFFYVEYKSFEKSKKAKNLFLMEIV